MLSVRVGLGDRSYPILIGKELLHSLGRQIRAHVTERGLAVIVSQKQIAVYYREILERSLSEQGFESVFFLTPFSRNSETAKSQLVFSRLIKFIAKQDGKHKSLFVVALGGGVIGDLAGFAASVYRRGIPYVQIPTTLTAQVDSAIGGKTAIDLPEGKNLLGAIYQPRLVLSDPDVLSSLPERHWSDGFAEVIKYGVIRDAALFSLLEKTGLDGIRKDPKLLERVIAACSKIKASVVEKDELDKKGVRIILNFGHTAGHAIEAASKYSRAYTHGEAVGIGMLVACDISAKLGVLRDAGLTERLEKTLVKFRLPLFYRGLPIDALLKAIGYDKKSEGGKNRFVLPVSLGKTAVVGDVPASVIAEALERRKA